ncbi:MAG: sporulation integral membrane protein YtvI [Faecousia sp.]
MQLRMKKLLLLALALVAAWVGVRYLLPVSMPFLLGGLLALAAEPGVRFLSGRLRFPRSAAAGVGVGTVFAVLCTLLTLLLGLLLRQLRVLAGILPQMELTIRAGLDSLQAWLMDLAQRTSPGVRAVLQRNVAQIFSGGAELLDQFTGYALTFAGNLLSRLPDSALGVGTAVLSAFLISAELPRIRSWLQTHVPQGRFDTVIRFIQKLRSTAGLWLIAQLKLVGITYLLLTVGFFLLRVEYAPVWALAVAAVDAFPILGTGTILVPWSLVCLLQHNSARALGLLGLYVATALTRSTLEPKLVGRQLGLDPLVTLIALYTGFRLWGLLGMFLMPMLAITVISMIPEVKKEQ